MNNAEPVADAGSVWPIALPGRAAKAAHNNIHRLGRIFVPYSAASFRKARPALDRRRPVLFHHSRPSTSPSGVTTSSIVFPSVFLPLTSYTLLPSGFRCTFSVFPLDPLFTPAPLP